MGQRIDTMKKIVRGIDKSALAGRPEAVTYGYHRTGTHSETERRPAAPSCGAWIT